MINVVYTSRPCDGLLYYSYEHTSYLNSLGIDAQMIIIVHRNHTEEEYINSINEKFIHCKNVIFDDYFPEEDDISFILGRSVLRIPYQNFDNYNEIQQFTLHLLFSNKLISVFAHYHHTTEYNKGIEFFKPKEVIQLCDMDIYTRGEGEFFIKAINFSIHKPVVEDIQFEYLFNGTNSSYYNTIKKLVKKYHSHGIITYEHAEDNYHDNTLNNIKAPIENLLGIFNTYVYTKNTFDPAPRITQECEYHGKEVIYLTDKTYIDGEEVYRNRGFVDIKDTIEPVLNAIKQLS